MHPAYLHPPFPPSLILTHCQNAVGWSSALPITVRGDRDSRDALPNGRPQSGVDRDLPRGRLAPNAGPTHLTDLSWMGCRQLEALK